MVLTRYFADNVLHEIFYTKYIAQEIQQKIYYIRYSKEDNPAYQSFAHFKLDQTPSVFIV